MEPTARATVNKLSAAVGCQDVVLPSLTRHRCLRSAESWITELEPLPLDPDFGAVFFAGRMTNDGAATFALRRG